MYFVNVLIHTDTTIVFLKRNTVKVKLSFTITKWAKLIIEHYSSKVYIQ